MFNGIILKKSVKAANMDILKQKMNLVYIVELKNMEDHFVLNVDMILIKVEMKEIILYAKIVFLLINIQMTITFLKELIILFPRSVMWFSVRTAESECISCTKTESISIPMSLKRTASQL